MYKIIHKIQENTLLTILFALAIGLFVNFLNKYFSNITSVFFEYNIYIKGVVYKIYTIVLAITFILLINNGSLKGYGFQKPKHVNYLKMIGITVSIMLASMLIGGVIFMGILNNLFPTENNSGFNDPESIILMIIRTWILSSIAEEIFVRGLFQGLLSSLKTKKILGLSLAVILSGLFFGLIHLSLLNTGKGHWFVGMIVFSVTILGLLTAYYREKTDSLIPPIIIHITANVVGSLPLLIMLLIPK